MIYPGSGIKSLGLVVVSSCWNAQSSSYNGGERKRDGRRGFDLGALLSIYLHESWVLALYIPEGERSAKRCDS
jgi:hypothetical protein